MYNHFQLLEPSSPQTTHPQHTTGTPQARPQDTTGTSNMSTPWVPPMAATQAHHGHIPRHTTRPPRAQPRAWQRPHEGPREHLTGGAGRLTRASWRHARSRAWPWQASLMLKASLSVPLLSMGMTLEEPIVEVQACEPELGVHDAQLQRHKHAERTAHEWRTAHEKAKAGTLGSSRPGTYPLTCLPFDTIALTCPFVCWAVPILLAEHLPWLCK